MGFLFPLEEKPLVAVGAKEPPLFLVHPARVLAHATRCTKPLLAGRASESLGAGMGKQVGVALVLEEKALLTLGAEEVFLLLMHLAHVLLQVASRVESLRAIRTGESAGVDVGNQVGVTLALEEKPLVALGTKEVFFLFVHLTHVSLQVASRVKLRRTA